MKDKNLQHFKTFDQFWGEFLQVTFHLQNRDRWPSRERKAIWFKEISKLGSGEILNLACGDGLFDICLSRKGFAVTSIDRVESVLKLARQDDETKRVNFISLEMDKAFFPAHSFDAICLLETVGLMTKEKDCRIFAKAFEWLKPGGKFIVDCPEKVSLSNVWEKQFSEGKVCCHSSYDEKTRLQRIEFSFLDKDGNCFGLLDPVRDELPGISRYIYPQNELMHLMKGAGFVVTEVPHYYPNDYFALLGQKES